MRTAQRHETITTDHESTKNNQFKIPSSWRHWWCILLAPKSVSACYLLNYMIDCQEFCNLYLICKVTILYKSDCTSQRCQKGVNGIKNKSPIPRCIAYFGIIFTACLSFELSHTWLMKPSFAVAWYDIYWSKHYIFTKKCNGIQPKIPFVAMKRAQCIQNSEIIRLKLSFLLWPCPFLTKQR